MTKKILPCLSWEYLRGVTKDSAGKSVCCLVHLTAILVASFALRRFCVLVMLYPPFLFLQAYFSCNVLKVG